MWPNTSYPSHSSLWGAEPTRFEPDVNANNVTALELIAFEMRRENHVIAYCRNANYDIALSKTLTEVVSRAQRNIRSKLIDRERDVGTGATKERVHSPFKCIHSWNQPGLYCLRCFAARCCVTRMYRMCDSKVRSETSAQPTFCRKTHWSESARRLPSL